MYISISISIYIYINNHLQSSESNAGNIFRHNGCETTLYEHHKLRRQRCEKKNTR